MSTHYKGLDWDIGETPIGSSTPDELTEYSYRAHASCPNCGSQISGVASYWSTDETATNFRLNDINFAACESCGDPL